MKTLLAILLATTSMAIAATSQTLATIHLFNNALDWPIYNLVQSPDGNSFYGVSAGGDYGAIVQITPAGTVTTVVSFSNTNGANPYAGLTLGSDGNFYGTTDRGGTSGHGVFYRLDLPPAVTAPPAGAFVLGGSNFTFTLTATGSTPLTYQWLFDGAPLASGTNASLTVSNVNPANAGAYQVIVTNSSGSVTSQVATLTMVAPASPFPSQVSAASITDGSLQFSWNTVNTYPPVGYQVQCTTNLLTPNWVNVGGVFTATNAALSFTNSLGANPQRFYRVLLVQ